MGTRTSFRIAAAFVMACLVATAFSCLNDRDSLAREAQIRPGILEDLVGWFPVHPDLYYRIRIDRSESELARHPEKLELYDDIAVAYDRLSHDPDAIRVIEQKRAVMINRGIKEPSSAQGALPNLYGEDLRQKARESSRDPWYRYYANAGTFWVHRWIREGRPSAKRDWLDKAQHDIDRAIQINPYAHELREFAQAEVIRWLREGEQRGGLSDFIFDNSENGGKRLVPALAGLIELGGAWESVDVYQAISQVGQGQLGRVAEDRVYELQTLGKQSLIGHVFVPSDFERVFGIEKYVGPNTDSEYRMLRKAADDYRAYRTNYELTRLQQGRHPDSDPHFYDDFHERKLPDFGFVPAGYLFWLFLETPMCLAPPTLIVALWIYSARRKRKNRRASSSV